MATARQIEANRRNAQKSTGPRTEDGKARTRWNAIQHGMASANVLPHENEAGFEELRDAFAESWQPANPQEFALVEQIAQGYWRIQRNRRLETAMFDAQIKTVKHKHEQSQKPAPNDDEVIVVAMSLKDNERCFRLMDRYDTRAESAYYRAMDRLRRLQADRKKCENEPKPPQQTKTIELKPELASFGGRPAFTATHTPATASTVISFQPQCANGNPCAMIEKVSRKTGT
jgi:hypothetical protein